MNSLVIMKPGYTGIKTCDYCRNVSNGLISRISKKAQQSVLDAGIAEEWRIISIDWKPFSKELLRMKAAGEKNYTLEVAPPEKDQVISLQIKAVKRPWLLKDLV